MNENRDSNRTQIIVAIIGVAGTLAAVLLSNLGWLKKSDQGKNESISGAFPIPKIYGLSYDDARKKLIDYGWVPDRKNYSHGVQFTYGNGKIFWERGYWEVDNCLGTGEAVCFFKFFDPSRRALTVTTAGEEADDGSYHAIVIRFSLSEK